MKIKLRRRHQFGLLGCLLFLGSCGETPTLKSDQINLGSTPSKKAQRNESSSKEVLQTSLGGISTSEIRFICSDGSSYSSFLTATLRATHEAFASRLLMWEESQPEELIVNLKQPVLTSSESERMSFLFEGSRFHSAASEGDLFLRHVFLGHYDFTTRQSSNKFLVNLKDIHPEARSRALELGLELTPYSGSRDSLIIPIYILDESAYEWVDNTGQKSLGLIPCSPENCFNPTLNESKKWIAFQIFSLESKRFEIGIFEKKEDFEFVQHHIPMERESFQPHFIDENTLAWIERDSTHTFFAVLNIQKMQVSRSPILEDSSSSFEIHSWSQSLDNESFHFLFKDPAQILKIVSIEKAKLKPYRTREIGLESLQDDRDAFAVYGFRAIDQDQLLISVETVFGPRLFRLHITEQGEELEPVTRTNCASFSIGINGGADVL